MLNKHLPQITSRRTRQIFLQKIRRGFAVVGTLGGLVLALSACGSGGEQTTSPTRGGTDGSYRDEAVAVLGDLGTTGRPGSADLPGASEAPGWGVLIAQFPADQRGQARAASALARVRTRGRLPSVFLEMRKDAVALLVGRHETIEQARRELAFVRNVEVDGVRPYQSAILAPPWAGPVAGSVPEFDLRTARARFGGRALYTLQIGVYGRLDGARPAGEELLEYRRTAERAVAQLRADGEQAFYYHGPRQSTVSVGIFGDKDHDPKKGQRGESSRLRRARENHPNNLLNGKGIVETHRDIDGRRVESFQHSALVDLPG